MFCFVFLFVCFLFLLCFVVVVTLLWHVRSTILDIRTSDVSANNGQDYTGISVTLDFPTDQTVMHVQGISIIRDDLHESSEQFTVTLDAPQLCEPSTALITIQDSTGRCFVKFHFFDKTKSLLDNCWISWEKNWHNEVFITLNKPKLWPVTQYN